MTIENVIITPLSARDIANAIIDQTKKPGSIVTEDIRLLCHAIALMVELKAKNGTVIS